MEQVDDFGPVALVMERLRRELTDRSEIEIATAVLDAWDHPRLSTGADQGSVEQSARARLSVPDVVV